MLTRFERARIVSARALQISMGAPILVKAEDTNDLLSVVLKELDAGVLPLTVFRVLPDGKNVLMDAQGEIFGKAEK
jgi:DNA-directed RNA polymerase subunit K